MTDFLRAKDIDDTARNSIDPLNYRHYYDDELQKEELEKYLAQEKESPEKEEPFEQEEKIGLGQKVTNFFKNDIPVKDVPVEDSGKESPFMNEVGDLSKYFLYTLLTGERIDPSVWLKHTAQARERNEDYKAVRAENERLKQEIALKKSQGEDTTSQESQAVENEQLSKTILNTPTEAEARGEVDPDATTQIDSSLGSDDQDDLANFLLSGDEDTNISDDEEVSSSQIDPSLGSDDQDDLLSGDGGMSPDLDDDDEEVISTNSDDDINETPPEHKRPQRNIAKRATEIVSDSNVSSTDPNTNTGTDPIVENPTTSTKPTVKTNPVEPLVKNSVAGTKEENPSVESSPKLKGNTQSQIEENKKRNETVRELQEEQRELGSVEPNLATDLQSKQVEKNIEKVKKGEEPDPSLSDTFVAKGKDWKDKRVNPKVHGTEYRDSKQNFQNSAQKNADIMGISKKDAIKRLDDYLGGGIA